MNIRLLHNSLNNMAGLYCDMERYEDALPVFQKSWTILKNTFGEEHPNTKTTEKNLQQLRAKLGELGLNDG